MSNLFLLLWLLFVLKNPMYWNVCYFDSVAPMHVNLWNPLNPPIPCILAWQLDPQHVRVCVCQLCVCKSRTAIPGIPPHWSHRQWCIFSITQSTPSSSPSSSPVRLQLKWVMTRISEGNKAEVSVLIVLYGSETPRRECCSLDTCAYACVYTLRCF